MELQVVITEAEIREIVAQHLIRERISPNAEAVDMDWISNDHDLLCAGNATINWRYFGKTD